MGVAGQWRQPAFYRPGSASLRKTPAKAETLLREVVAAYPQEYQVAYSLGLLLAEKKKYGEAAHSLASAAGGMPDHARVHYNLGVLLDYLGKGSEAERALLRALEIEPENIHFLTAAAQYHVKHAQYEEAKLLTERIAAAEAKDRAGTP